MVALLIDQGHNGVRVFAYPKDAISEKYLRNVDAAVLVEHRLQQFAVLETCDTSITAHTKTATG